MDPSPLLQEYEIELLQPMANVPQIRCRSNQEILQLVEVIGGMNVILNHCLSSDNPYNLSSDQLTQINQILTSSQTPKTKTNLEPTILNLDINNNVLYQLFGDSKVIQFFKSKCYVMHSFHHYISDNVFLWFRFPSTEREITLQYIPCVIYHDITSTFNNFAVN
eukprot:465426_1